MCTNYATCWCRRKRNILLKGVIKSRCVSCTWLESCAFTLSRSCLRSIGIFSCFSFRVQPRPTLCPTHSLTANSTGATFFLEVLDHLLTILYWDFFVVSNARDILNWGKVWWNSVSIQGLGKPYIAQTGLKHQRILLPLPPKCFVCHHACLVRNIHKHATPCLVLCLAIPVWINDIIP